MTKQQTTKTKRCGKYCLKLSGKLKTFYKGTIIIDYKPISKSKDKKNISILPTFNNDKKYYTPAFNLPFSQKQPQQIQIKDHQKRVLQSQAQISQIFVSKPRSKQKYCGVCRNYYEDYLQHTQLDFHISKLQNSCFQKYLIEESQKFKKILQKQSQIELQKANTDSSCQTIISRQLEAIQQYFDLA